MTATATTTAIRTITGSTNTFARGSSKSFIYVTPAIGSPAEGRREATLGSLAMNGVLGVTRLTSSKDLSVAGYTEAQGGAMVTAQYHLPEGLVLKVFASISRPNQFPDMAAIFLRVRATAALNRVMITQTRAEDVLHNGGLVEGRFDILTGEQIAAVLPNARVSSDSEVARLFAVSQLSPALTEKKTVATADGGTVEVEEVTRSRKFRF